jgi:hypothetical protein
MSKYKSWNFEKVYSFTSQPGEKILPSIPDTILPEILIKDNLIDTKLHLALHEYLLNQTWHHWWAPLPGETQIYKPNDWDDSWINAAVMSRSIGMPRCMFGSDEDSVRKKHPLVWELWRQINSALGDQWDITGIPEEMAWDKYPVPVPSDPTFQLPTVFQAPELPAVPPVQTYWAAFAFGISERIKPIKTAVLTFIFFIFITPRLTDTAVNLFNSLLILFPLQFIRKVQTKFISACAGENLVRCTLLHLGISTKLFIKIKCF